MGRPGVKFAVPKFQPSDPGPLVDEIVVQIAPSVRCWERAGCIHFKDELVRCRRGAYSSPSGALQRGRDRRGNFFDAFPFNCPSIDGGL